MSNRGAVAPLLLNINYQSFSDIASGVTIVEPLLFEHAETNIVFLGVKNEAKPRVILRNLREAKFKIFEFQSNPVLLARPQAILRLSPSSPQAAP